MKKFFLALLIVYSASMVAQTGAPAEPAGSEKPSVEPNMSLLAELAVSVDAGKAKPGDVITAKLQQEKGAATEKLLPSGSTLIGHVVEAHGRSKEDPQSRLSISFDKARLKNGTELPLNLIVEAFTVPAPPPPPRPSGDGLGSLNDSMSRAAGPMSSGGGRVNVPATSPSRDTGTTNSIQEPVWQRQGATRIAGSSGLPDVKIASTRQASGSFTVLTSSSHQVKLQKHTLVYLLTVSAEDQGATK